MTPPRRERVVDALALVVLKLAVGAWILRVGFTHVSDDDYARTVIAQQFARAPRLDPSGTSWLPLPFWITGTAMLAFGRTLQVARGVAIVLGALAVVAPYLGMREVGVGRRRALVATALAMASPWSAWLGVATVPEGWTGALVGAALIAMPSSRARPWAAAALLAGALARYETWPACLAFAALCGVRAARGPGRPRELAALGTALAGPLAWMAWNAHAHDGPLHFVGRVARFRQAVGAAAQPLADKLLEYPAALAGDARVATALGVIAAIGLASTPLRARWAWPLGASATIVAFLVWGDVRDGAPTHHAARALVAVTWVLTAAGVDALFAAGDASALRRWPRGLRLAGGAALGVLAAAWTYVGWSPYPGATDGDRRDAQLARGATMRALGVHEAVITPCAFEHFALLAAWGEPEHATIEARTGATVTATCPTVLER